MDQFNIEDTLNSFSGMSRAQNEASFDKVWKAMQQDSNKSRVVTMWIYRAAVVLVVLAGANMYSYWQKQHGHRETAIERFADEYGFTQND